MVLPLAAALALAHQCAPAVAPQTLLAVVQVESRFDELAIGINGPAPGRLAPKSVREAVASARTLISSGRNVDLGLGQINSRNLSRLGLAVEDAFDPCANLGAASRVLSDAYVQGGAGRAGPQVALRRALSIYNTGTPERGLTNGYVQKVAGAAAALVPPLQAARGGAPTAAGPEEPPARPSWDVFGDARGRRASFVITVPSSARGGRP